MTGDPLQGATVTVVDSKGNALGQGIITDSTGKFTLTSDALYGNFLLVTYTGLLPVMMSADMLNATDYKEIDLYPKDLPPVIVTPSKSSWVWWLLGGIVAVGVWQAGSSKRKRKSATS